MKKKKDIRHWAEPLLQGLAFWLGYKNQLYRHYPLTEGAIIGEALHLIYSNLYNDEKLECEKMYREIGVKSAGQTRVDLLISEKDKVIAAIEVKRNIKEYKLIDKDFIKLAELKSINDDIQCFLLYVGQSARPDKFVTESGRAIRKELEGKGYFARVRMVRKASKSFDNKDKANYACLIEVSVK